MTDKPKTSDKAPIGMIVAALFDIEDRISKGTFDRSGVADELSHWAAALATYKAAPALDFTPAELRRIADILESNNDQPGFDFASAVAAMEAENMSANSKPTVSDTTRAAFLLAADTLNRFALLARSDPGVDSEMAAKINEWQQELSTCDWPILGYDTSDPPACPTCGALYGEMDHAAEPCLPLVYVKDGHPNITVEPSGTVTQGDARFAQFPTADEACTYLEDVGWHRRGRITLDEVIDEATAMGLLDDGPLVPAATDGSEGDGPNLYDADTNEWIGYATPAQVAASGAASNRDGGSGIIRIDRTTGALSETGRRVYTDGWMERSE